MKAKSKTKIIAEYLERQYRRQLKKGELRRSEFAMSMASVSKTANGLSRSKAFRHLFGEQLQAIIDEMEGKAP